MSVCTNSSILKVIYFLKIIVIIIKIAVPIILVVLAMIDLFKAVIASDDKEKQKAVKLLIKRVIYSLLIFFVPTIVNTLMITIGNIGESENFTDCLENATIENINKYQAEEEKKKQEEEKKNQSGNSSNTDNSDNSGSSGNNTNTDSSDRQKVVENLAAFIASEVGYSKNDYWTGLLFQMAVFMNNYGSQTAYSGVNINTKMTTDSICKVLSVKYKGGGRLYSDKYCYLTYEDLAKNSGVKSVSKDRQKFLEAAVQAVLNKEFTIPKNVVFARSEKGSIKNSYNIIYTSKSGQWFATKGNFSNVDIYGNKVSTNKQYYIKKANELYKKYVKN